jgi:hypothetical protein
MRFNVLFQRENYSDEKGLFYTSDINEAFKQYVNYLNGNLPKSIEDKSYPLFSYYITDKNELIHNESTNILESKYIVELCQESSNKVIDQLGKKDIKYYQIQALCFAISRDYQIYCQFSHNQMNISKTINTISFDDLNDYSKLKLVLTLKSLTNGHKI